MSKPCADDERNMRSADAVALGQLFVLLKCVEDGRFEDAARVAVTCRKSADAQKAASDKYLAALNSELAKL